MYNVTAETGKADFNLLSFHLHFCVLYIYIYIYIYRCLNIYIGYVHVAKIMNYHSGLIFVVFMLSLIKEK
jgi:hypothetical protein